MIETKTIPAGAELLPTNSLNQNYILYEFPSRICLVCGKLEREEVKVADTGDAWLCDRCRNTLLKLIEDANTSNALNALEQENKEGKEEVTDRNVGKWIPVTERVPESVRKSYLCLTDTGYHCEVRWTDNVYGLLTSSMDNEWGWSIADVPQFCKITHWMPLPQPPKGEEE